MSRDSQRSKVYAAEWEVFHPERAWPDGGTDYETEDLTIKECQAYANHVTSSPLWKAMRGRVFVHVKPVRHRRYARGWKNMIEIPPWAHHRRIILHELMHSLVQARVSRNSLHDPDYVFVYRRFIEQEFGIDRRRAFDRAAEDRGVKWSNGANIRARYPGIV